MPSTGDPITKMDWQWYFFFTAYGMQHMPIYIDAPVITPIKTQKWYHDIISYIIKDEDTAWKKVNKIILEKKYLSQLVHSLKTKKDFVPLWMFKKL